ncbi:TrbI/VirB10 family protein [Duganella sp. BuS-21]|uniref:TrbI/VirB10 family protein n=1 Tax=Duganella sp. BuS-21 TaxID=2943848 RepID=UPI0035A6EBFE
MTTSEANDFGNAQERIVSVNDYGGAKQPLWRRALWATIIAALLAVSVMASINNWRARASAAESDQTKAKRQAARSDNDPSRRTFPLAASPPATVPRAQPGAEVGLPLPAPSERRCDDGMPGEPMTGLDGKVMLAPAGQPIRICRNGQMLIPPWPEPAVAGNRQAQAAAATGVPASAGATKTPHARADRYGGDIVLPSASGELAAGSTPAVVATSAPAIGSKHDETLPALGKDQDAGPGQAAAGSLHALLRPARISAVRAQLLENRDMLLPQSRTIDCNLSLRVVSEVAGMAVCVLSSYVYGDTGVAVLAEPGSVATGDYLALAAQGQRRLFIIWNRLKTPSGVVIELASPASDALGTSGVEGYVDNRWAERIGAAALLSTVQDTIAYQTARASAGDGNGNGGIAVFPNTSQAGSRLAEQILASTININPTIFKQQGDRASITVARDLDFGSVYALRTK